MPTMKLINFQGEVVGSLELSDAVFGAPIHVPAMHQVVVAQLANARQGTACAKSRGEVSGGGRKPLGQRDDIDKLATMAHESQNPNLISLFEYLPSLEELKKGTVADVLKKSADAVRAETETVAKTDDN